MPQDKYYGQALGISDPSNEPRAVEPDDDADLPNGQCNYIYVGTAGDLSAVYEDSGPTPVLHKALTVGWHPLRPKRIRASGTTAADIVVHY